MVGLDKGWHSSASPFAFVFDTNMSARQGVRESCNPVRNVLKTLTSKPRTRLPTSRKMRSNRLTELWYRLIGNERGVMLAY
jgi:hypothetical protein